MGTEIKKVPLAKNKQNLLAELTEAIAEVKKAEIYALKKGVKYHEAFDTLKKRGGARAGSGAPKKTVIKTNRSVKLTDVEYNSIIEKYGSFSKGVKALLHA